MRIDGEKHPRLLRRFTVRNTPIWQTDSGYLSWAMHDGFSTRWANLNGAIVFPTAESALKAAEKFNGFVTTTWVEWDDIFRREDV